jgi:hypothetical protein
MATTIQQIHENVENVNFRIHPDAYVEFRHWIEDDCPQSDFRDEDDDVRLIDPHDVYIDFVTRIEA